MLDHRLVPQVDGDCVSLCARDQLVGCCQAMANDPIEQLERRVTLGLSWIDRPEPRELSVNVALARRDFVRSLLG
jgi:hypothetical protein